MYIQTGVCCSQDVRLPYNQKYVAKFFEVLNDFMKSLCFFSTYAPLDQITWFQPSVFCINISSGEPFLITGNKNSFLLFVTWNILHWLIG